MKLNLNPKEFLALYNFLRENVPYERNTDSAVLLSQVRDRLNTCLLELLMSGQRNEQLDAWLGSQQSKLETKKINVDNIENDSTLGYFDVDPKCPRPPPNRIIKEGDIRLAPDPKMPHVKRRTYL